MPSGWSGQEPGRIPLSMMTQLRSDIGPGGYAQADAAAAYLRMAAAFQAAVGVPLKFVEAYRDYETSVHLFTGRYVRVATKTGIFWDGSYWKIKPGMAAAGVPGTSHHLEGLAFDFAAPLTSWATAGQKWFRANEARFGFSAAQGVADGEPWHKVYVGPTPTVAGSGAQQITNNLPQIEEQDMYLVKRIGSDQRAYLNGLECVMAPGLFQHLSLEPDGKSHTMDVIDRDATPLTITTLGTVEFDIWVSVFHIPPGYVGPGGSYLAAGDPNLNRGANLG